MSTKFILNSLRTIKGKALDICADTKSQFQSIFEAQYDKEHIRHLLDNTFSLTKGEKKVIKEMYSEIIPCISRGFDFFLAMKRLDKFDVNYIPSSYYYPYMLKVLNPEKFKKLLCHKSLFKIVYQDGILHPETPLRSIAGIYLNSQNKPVTTEEAVRIIENIESAVLFKPATDSNCGNGIRYIDKDKLGDLCESIRNRSIVRYEADFVIQLPVRQSEETRVFNPSSLNCLRITTLNLNGIVSTHSVTLKCGPKDSKVDNIGSGKKGVIVGVKPNGSLAPFGFYGNGEMTESHNGILFKDRKLSSLDNIIENTKAIHKNVEDCHVIGWDIAIDENGNAVLIEGNTNYPGISLEQMCSGPVFGDRTGEVISYIADYNRVINRR